MELSKETPKEAMARLSQYIDVRNKEFQAKLSQATTTGDKRDILVAYTKPQYNLMTLFSSPSPWVSEVVEEFTEQYQGKQPEVQVTVQEAVKPKTPKKSVPMKSRRTGKVLYTRSVPKMFTFREKTFIEMAVRKGLKPKAVHKLYNETFESPRSKSSISTKMSRVRKK